jgi:hypothetical protein
MPTNGTHQPSDAASNRHGFPTRQAMFYARAMNNGSTNGAGPLLRAVATLQLKLLLDALRDLVLSPLSLAATLVDLVLVKRQSPRYFRAVLRLGARSDRWIDVWSGGEEDHVPSRESVDALLFRVEEVVRDPQSGARRARVLKRWAERQIARARQRAATQASVRPGTEMEVEATKRDAANRER